VGSQVRLSNGQEAEIIFFEQESPTRPMVKLISTGEIVQLTKKPTIYIEEIINM
jgi:hypothetical protein